MFKKIFIASAVLIPFSIVSAETLNDKLENIESKSTSIVSPSQNRSSTPAEELFTGDTKLACEAILCLSSGNRPNECSPSLHRYFSIHHKKFSDTLNARHSFLSLCPSSREEGMPALVQAIVNGAGRCDAAELNRINQATYIEVKKVKTGFGKTIEIRTPKQYVRNKKPSYCTAYINHGWTQLGTRYVGEEKNGGRWVD